MVSRHFVKYVVAGQIRNEFIIDRKGKAYNNNLGGSLLYAAAATNHWGGQTGLLGVVSQDFPAEKIESLAQYKLDTRGIKVTPEFSKTNDFYAYPKDNVCIRDNPVAVYAANHLPLPRELMEFTAIEQSRENRSLSSRIFLEDIPLDYLDASAAHLCPLDISFQLQSSTLLQRGSIRTITIQPDPASMIPGKFEDVAILTKDCAAIITGEAELRSLFNFISDDLMEMMERICSYGSQNIIVKNILNGYSLYEREYGKHYHLPSYPAKRVDPTGEMDVFCGAFLAGLHETYDPLHALTLSSAAASIKVEGTGPFSIMSSLPGLDKARMASLRDKLVRC